MQKGLKQAEILGFTGPAWSNYELGKSVPALNDFISISKYFEVDEHSLLHVDLEKKGKNLKEPKLVKNRKTGQKFEENWGKNKDFSEHFEGNIITINEPQNEYKSVVRMPQVITVDSQGEENVIMVPVRARAGYLNGYSDPQFIESLPAYRLPGLNNGTFRLFEVEGLSMYPTLHGGDMIIGSFVDQLRDVRDDRVYVVVTKQDGVVVKRVINRIEKDGKLILKSDNYKERDMYPPIVCDPLDIIEMWYAIGFISRQMRPPAEMYNRIIDLEGRLTILEQSHKK